MNTLGIIIACGKEEEIASGTEAAFLTLGNTPMIVHTLRTFQDSAAVDGVIVAVSKERVDATIHAIKRYGCTKVCGVVIGGVNRLSTLRTVYAKMPESASIVVIHEASRPFVRKTVLAETVKAAKRYGCAVAAHKVPDATKSVPKGMKATKTNERNTVWAVQTPQAFKSDVLEKIIDTKARVAVKIIDDESEFVRKPAEVHMVEAGSGNIKIRTKQDLAIATAMQNANIS
ncbi:MAG: 2-C-methyl-D-erythritol 4-phosphate cytidylyltransferase [Verrucomicrobiota bacterium]|nr:2-C-methyl-D-erythritol 4-phosphate cytidylyltransferase [Verrucomicrobiota bacterium]